MLLFDTLTQKKQEFITLEPKKVKMYVCGITPYDTTHLGHASTYVFFDTLKRYLEYKGYEVTYTQNVTDIDDDILKRAKRDGKNWKELGQFWTDKFLNDLKSLNVLLPEHYVKATDSIEKIIEITSELIKKAFAYEKNGYVYFEVSSFPRFGKLSKFNESQMLLLLKERGGNIDDPNKKAPLDFLLWQPSKEDEPFWESPWGKGRPGWHIECSAMVNEFLGEQIDIHGGGRDLVYPHHESEIAQTESYTGKILYVTYWMHMAMVMYQGEKMSKSLGNLVLVSDLLKTYTPEAIRWVLLSHHYRTPWEFTMDELNQAQETVNTLFNNLKGINKDTADKNELIDTLELLEDDFNTPKLLESIIQMAQTNKKAEAAFLFELLGFKLV